MRRLLITLALLPSLALADACVIRSRQGSVDVQVCQSNIDIPIQLFHEGFCQPQLKGQQTEVRFVARCPVGEIGICQGARSPGVPYRQDIHYYGEPGDGRFLAVACVQQNRGSWRVP
jgi:hypothetical protein